MEAIITGLVLTKVNDVDFTPVVVHPEGLEDGFLFEGYPDENEDEEERLKVAYNDQYVAVPGYTEQESDQRVALEIRQNDFHTSGTTSARAGC